jgi:Spy/CpxP family protein refolding chaperone
MTANRAVRWAAIVALVTGGGIFVGQAMTQDTKPPAPAAPATDKPADPMVEWLKTRGIQVTPEQAESARKIIDNVQNGGQVDPEQVQKLVSDIGKQVQARAQSRIKELLESTDAEWEVLGPKVQKVQDLMLQSGNIGGGLGRFGMGGMAGMAGMGGINLAGGEPSDIQKKRQALQEIMKNKDAPVEDVRTALKDYREAQAKTKTDLVKARADVKELLTVRQEAQLVKMGILE